MLQKQSLPSGALELLRRIQNLPGMEEMLQFYSQKYPGMEQFMVIKSLTWFEDAENEPDPGVLYPLDWEKVKTAIVEAVRKYI